jgi:hypothetical protein
MAVHWVPGKRVSTTKSLKRCISIMRQLMRPFVPLH